jgi:hypothetical protein
MVLGAEDHGAIVDPVERRGRGGQAGWAASVVGKWDAVISFGAFAR